MKLRKLLSVQILVPIVLAAAALLLFLALHPSKDTPGLQRQAETTKVAVQSGLPVRIRIPRLRVDAAIDQMGLTPEGDMQAPSKPQNAGWYKFGPLPGNAGSAVIAGHYGPAKNGETTVFNELHKLAKGDHIAVEDEKGAVATFVVRELLTYKSNEIVPDVFHSNDGKAHLNLVTCQGTWDKGQQTYSNRLVVFADRKLD